MRLENSQDYLALQCSQQVSETSLHNVITCIVQGNSHNVKKIVTVCLSRNQSIFKKVFNYELLTERMNIIREELMMKCMHPSRLERWIEMGGEIDDF
jgi:hypothetical protein